MFRKSARVSMDWKVAGSLMIVLAVAFEAHAVARTGAGADANGIYVLHAFFEPEFDPFSEVGEEVTGTFSFTKLPDSGIRVIGQCNTGSDAPYPCADFP